MGLPAPLPIHPADLRRHPQAVGKTTPPVGAFLHTAGRMYNLLRTVGKRPAPVEVSTTLAHALGHESMLSIHAAKTKTIPLSLCVTLDVVKAALVVQLMADYNVPELIAKDIVANCRGLQRLTAVRPHDKTPVPAPDNSIVTHFGGKLPNS